MQPRWRDPLTALSLANLLLLPVWQSLLIGDRHPYMDKHAPDWRYHVAAVGLMLVLAVCLWLAWHWAGRCGERGRRLARGAFVVSLIAPLNFLKLQIPGLGGVQLEKFLTPGIYWALAAAAGVAWIMLARRTSFAVWTRRAVLGLLPLVPITTTQALWHAAHDPPLIGHLPPPAPVLTRSPAPFRLVWIVFDEFDQRVAFDQRPAGLALPELDHWQQQEFQATAAYPPAGMTFLSMPALFTGLPVTQASPAGPDDLALTVAGRADPILWSRQETIFRRLRAAGGDSALVGWYHPYGRILGADLIDCFWESNEADSLFVEAASPAAVIGKLGSWVLRYVPLSPRLQISNSDRYRQVWVDYFRSIRDQSRRMLADPAWDLLVIHSSIPHPRGLYNRHTGQMMQLADTYASSYLDNLVLLDRTLAEIRRQLENQGDWDRTAVLVSSDHWWRHHLHDGILVPEERPLAKGNDHRIPFLLHLPGSQPVRYGTPFNTLLTGDLLMALWHGEVRRADQLVPWLDRHRQVPAEFPSTQVTWPYPGQPAHALDY
jgi:hypothetical protein